MSNAPAIEVTRDPRTGATRRILDPHPGFTGQAPQVQERLAALFREMHMALGINLDDPNSKETPERAAKAFAREFFAGLDLSNFPKLTCFPNNRKVDAIQLVTIDYFHSMCAHHWAAFSGRAWIAYIPGDKLLGLSKFARVLHFYAARPQIQENLTVDVADFFEDLLKPVGLGVVVEATHSCMCARGVRTHGATLTSAMHGAFLTKPEARKEFFDLVSLSRARE